MANETNEALGGWRNKTIELAGQKTSDGRTNLDIFNDLKKKDGNNMEKLYQDLHASGMSQSEASNGVGTYSHMKTVENKNNELGQAFQQKFEQSLSPEEQAKYKTLQPSGDQNAITDFENHVSENNPNANQALLVERQAKADAYVISQVDLDIEKAGNNVASLPSVTVGTMVMPSDERTFRS